MPDKRQVRSSGDLLSREREMALKAAKEISVKFIECGRISPESFTTVFPALYATILRSFRAEEGVCHGTDEMERDIQHRKR